MRLDVFADHGYIGGMIVTLTLAVIAILAVGVMLLVQRRSELQQAMIADGFAPHEVRKAMRLFDQKRHVEMSSYCREVIERRALVVQCDWTKAESYIKFKRGIYAS